MTKQTLFKGTMILTVAAFITKILGFANFPKKMKKTHIYLLHSTKTLRLMN